MAWRPLKLEPAAVGYTLVNCTGNVVHHDIHEMQLHHERECRAPLIQSGSEDLQCTKCLHLLNKSTTLSGHF